METEQQHFSRDEAVAAGANRYFGKPCPRHPAAEGKRRTRSAECVECRRERQAKWIAAKRLRLSEQAKENV